MSKEKTYTLQGCSLVLRGDLNLSVFADEQGVRLTVSGLEEEYLALRNFTYVAIPLLCTQLARSLHAGDSTCP